MLVGAVLCDYVTVDVNRGPSNMTRGLWHVIR